MTITDDAKPTSAKVNVAVRVRPFNKREIDLHTVCVVDMENQQTILNPPPVTGKQSDKKQTKTFAFDHCFWSMDATNTDKFADQDEVFCKLGSNLLDNVFSGYNACIFAYGQTGSGKSYTMMGSRDQPGLIPRLCAALFERIATETNDLHSYKVEVSYMEIYNEKVRDLLDPNGGRSNLRVREHKSLGTYVDGLQLLASSSAHDIEELMSEGNKSRTVAATKMNAESSRSHAVFTLKVTQTLTDKQSGVSGERVSKVSLVDLAGSERASKTGAAGDRLKEGSNINKSLTTLGLVISALADQASGKAKTKFVPYRDSVLTWILKDNLGGNSRTAMIATISPSADNYEETLSTLRYADRAKRIVNKAVVNEDPNAKIIRELREEVDKLQQQLKQSESMRAPDLKEKLEESEKLIKEISTTWEEKLRKTEEVHKKRQETLENMGISLEASGIKVQKTKCFLVNLNADPSLNELLVYYLKPNTSVGQSEDCDMQLSGLGITQHHADIEVTNTQNVFITPHDNARTCINGRPITTRTSLRHGDRVLWGNNHFFRINLPRGIPRLVRKEADNDQDSSESNTSHVSQDGDTSLNESSVDYEFAQREVLMNEAEAPMQETILSLEREFQQLHGSTQDVVPLDDSERQKYEQEIETLRKQLLTFSPRGSSDSLDKISSKEGGEKEQEGHVSPPHSEIVDDQYRSWRREREDVFRSSLHCLQKNLMHAQALSREANSLAVEMKKQTEFVVTLQIPAHNLTANRRNALLCEPAVQVIRQGRDCQIWSVEKLENRLVDMRELYMEHQHTDSNVNGDEVLLNDRSDPFNETERNQILIGVANIFLSCLLTDVPLRYPVPIINQQGQANGKLIIEMQRVFGDIPDRMLNGDDFSGSEESVTTISDSSASSGADVTNHETSNQFNSHGHESTMHIHSSVMDNHKSKPARRNFQQITCRLTIVEAQGLPSTLSHFVQCQYVFLDCPEVILVPPDLSPDAVSPKSSRSTLNIKFHHTMEFTCNVTEELVDRITSGSSLAIELWGHRDRYNQGQRVRGSSSTKSRDDARSSRFRSSSILREKNKTLKERWSEVLKRLHLDVRILELNEAGEYEDVEIIHKPDVATKGIFQIKQGQSRRVQVSLKPVDSSGTLPLLCENVASVYAGSITASNASNNSALDSYQDIDLTILRETWLDTLTKRKQHLDKQMGLISATEAKTELEKERESHLMDQYVTLTEERNAVYAPTHDSGIPGAPAVGDPPPSVEMHVPQLFLNIDASNSEDEMILHPCGLDSHLSDEIPGSFVQLPVIRHFESEIDQWVGAVVSWDSSVHDSALLNRVTASNERIYVTLKVHVSLSHPVEMDVVLRKRICVQVYKQKGFTASFIRKMQGKVTSSSGVIYEIVSNIPLSSRDSEDRESLAIMAASGAKFQSIKEEDSGSDSSDWDEMNRSTPFEQYVTRAMRSVDDILYLDKMRQQVALRESAAAIRKLTGDDHKYITKKLTIPRARSISGFSTVSKINVNKKRMSTTPVHQPPTRHFVESLDINKTSDGR